MLRGAIGIKCAQILKDAVAHREAGNFLSRTYNVLRAARPFIVQERNRRFFFIGPPMEAPKMLRMSLGGLLQSLGLGSVQLVSCESLLK